MTDQEAKDHAQKVHALIQSEPCLKLLQDLVKEEADKNKHNEAALMQFLMIYFDFIGVHYDKFLKATKL